MAFFSVLTVAAAAATMSPVDVRVAEPDPTVLFRWDEGKVVFDACRDYTLGTLASGSACRARVNAGELAPSLAILSRTLFSEKDNADEALRQLHELWLAHDQNPAVGYFLGTVYATGESRIPDYERAVAYLMPAADRGQPAAADLLATLLLDGKGAPKNVPRAIELLDFAAREGFPRAGAMLGLLYLRGHHVEEDRELGRAYLEAAVAAGIIQAQNHLNLIETSDKINNFQLIPAPQPEQVQLTRYGPFDNPPIPPAVGFTPAFQELHYRSYSDEATFEYLRQNRFALPSAYTYEFARRAVPRDPEAALRAYLVARARTLYDGSRCADGQPAEALYAWDRLVGRDLKAIIGKVAATEQLVEEALQEFDRYPADEEPWWICRTAPSEYSSAMAGDVGPLQLKPRAEWPALLQKARADLREAAAKLP